MQSVKDRAIAIAVGALPTAGWVAAGLFLFLADNRAVNERALIRREIAEALVKADQRDDAKRQAMLREITDLIRAEFLQVKTELARYRSGKEELEGSKP